MHQLAVRNHSEKPLAMRKAQSAGFFPLQIAPRPLFSPMLQKKPACACACACGGGCPRCQGKLPIQTKLAVSQPGDIYEQEADRVAEQVMRMPAPTLQRACAGCSAGDTTCPECEAEKEELLQRKADRDLDKSGFVSDSFLHSLGPGQPLDAATRAFFEPRFGHDFSRVRVHTDAKATDSAQHINASAYTVGSHIVFQLGHYAPDSKEGRSLLAHELTHVVQQLPGMAKPAGTSSGIAQESSASPMQPVKLHRKSESSDDLFKSSFGDQEGEGGEATESPKVSCPPVPTKLGDVIPDPACPKATHTGTNELARFNFCLDSDELISPEQLGELNKIVTSSHPKTRFLLHGYASIEGKAAYNFRLACHRANRIAAALDQVIADRVRRRMVKQNPDATSERVEEEVQSEIQSRVETATQGPTTEFGPREANRVVIVFGQVPGGEEPEEPGCEDAPRKIGDITPEIGCDVPTVDLTEMDGGPHLTHFHFCLDSDVLTAVQPSDIGRFALRQAAKATFVVHGFASTEGAPDYNQRLSCHRALRVARELMNAGVRPEQIREVSGLGKTTAFAGGPEFNRVAVVLAEGGEVAPLAGGTRPAGTREQKLAVRDEALKRLLSGQYNLAADAYISFWTCGRSATVSQAVERLTIEVRPGNADEMLRDDANGTEEGFGVNFVRLSNVALRADNAIECTMGRLIDMAFHHAVQGNPDLPGDLTTRKAARHSAGLHLIHLAGLSGCVGRRASQSDLPGKPQGIDEPLVDDPREGMPAPSCAEAPQPTRLHPPVKGAKEREEPTFEVVGKPQFNTATGKLTTNFDPEAANRSSRRLITRPETGIITATANVQLVGKRDVFADYEVGFIQAIQSDETEVEYDSGHHVIQQLPAPIRLAAMKGDAPVPAPWTTMNAMSRPDADGKASVTATGSGLNSETAIGLRQLKSTFPNSAITGFEAGTRIAIWLIARRLGAPLDRFSVHFLDGVEYDLTQICHLEHRRIKGTLGQPTLAGGETELPIFVGGFHATKPSLLPADPALARLGGPVASDIGLFNQIKRIIEPKAATEAGLGIPELTTVVADILDNLVLFETEEEARKGAPGTKMPRLGFDFIPLKVTLPIVRQTGRLMNPEKPEIVVKVEGPGLGHVAGEELATALEFRFRNRSFQGQDVVVRPSVVSGTGEVGNVTVSLAPLPRLPGAPKEQESDFLKRADVLDNMAEAWACTEFTKRPEFVFFGEREFARAYEMDRDKKLHPEPPDRLVAGEEQTDEGFETRVPCLPSSGSRVGLGHFHTHPEIEIPPKPSPGDKEYARKCGAQHYIITDNRVFRYFADGTVFEVKVRLPKVKGCHKINIDQIVKEKKD